MQHDIVDLGHGAYLVGRQAIRVMRGAIDVATPEGRACLLEQAEAMASSPLWPRPYGEHTAARILPKEVLEGSDGYLAEPCHMSRMPDCAKDVLRKEFPEYADQI